MKSYPYMAFAEMAASGRGNTRTYVTDTLKFATKKSGSWVVSTVEITDMGGYTPASQSSLTPYPNHYDEPLVANNGSFFCLLVDKTAGVYYPFLEGGFSAWISNNEGTTWTSVIPTGLGSAYGQRLLCVNGVFGLWDGHDIWYTSADGRAWTAHEWDTSAYGWMYNHSWTHVDDEGTMFAVLEGDNEAIYITNTTDFVTWTTPVLVSAGGWQWYDGLSIASIGKELIIAAVDFPAGVIHVFRSWDRGKTWDAPIDLSLMSFFGVEDFNYWLTNDYCIVQIILDGDKAAIITSIDRDDYDPALYNYFDMVSISCDDITLETPVWSGASLYPKQGWLNQISAQDPVGHASWTIFADYTYASEWSDGWYDMDTRAFWEVSGVAPSFTWIDSMTPGYGDAMSTFYWDTWISYHYAADDLSATTYSRYAYDVNCYREFSRGGFAYFF